MSTISQKRIALAWLARQFIGAIETKPNGGPLVEKFQRATDGISSGEPWCVGFVQYCTKSIDELSALLNGGGSKSSLFSTEWTIALYDQSPHKYKDPDIGHVVVWQSTTNSNRGHCGIVVDVIGPEVHTVEGNTAIASGDQREGDGVWNKIRMNGNVPGLKRLGYIGVWE